MSKLLEFTKKIYAVENVGGSMFLTDNDPTETEDWEHLYFDVQEGYYYPTDQNRNGYFYSPELNKWLVIKNGTPINNWYESREEILHVQSKWNQVLSEIEKYLTSIGGEPQPVLYLEDVQKFMNTNGIDWLKMYNYKNNIFLVKLDVQNLPTQLCVITKEFDQLCLKEIGNEF